MNAAARSVSLGLTRQDKRPESCVVSWLSRANSEHPMQLKPRTAEINRKKDVILVNVVKCIVV